MLGAGLVGMVFVGAGLYLRLGVGVAEAALTAFLLVPLPVLSVAQLSALEGMPLHRPAIYLSSAVTLGVLTLAALGVGAAGPGLAALGLHPVPLGTLAAATLRLAAATALLTALAWAVERWARIRERPLLLALIPRTRRERRLFAGLSVVAGVGEEIVFRGFLLAVLIPALGGPAPALVVSSLAFGVLHAYQGPWGMARTGLFGALFGVSVVVEASLWPAVIVHVLYDWYGGLVRRPPPPPGGAHPETLHAPKG